MSKFQFRKRAASATATAAAAAKLAVDTHKFLSFRLGDENFGIPILNIKEIIEYGNITEIPMMPEFIRGAINLRGHIVPIMDLAVRLGRDSFDVSRRTCIVIVEMLLNNTKMDVGVVVDAVNEVIDIEPDQIDPAPSFGGHIESEFILGMGKIGESFLVLLNMDKVISHADVRALQTAGSDFGMSMGNNAKTGKHAAKGSSKQASKSGSANQTIGAKSRARAAQEEDDSERKVERAEHAVHAEYAEYAIHAEHALHAEHVAHDAENDQDDVAVADEDDTDETPNNRAMHVEHVEPVVQETVAEHTETAMTHEPYSGESHVEHKLPDDSDMQALQNAVASYDESVAKNEMELGSAIVDVDHHGEHDHHELGEINLSHGVESESDHHALHDEQSIHTISDSSESVATNHEQHANLEGETPKSSDEDDDGSEPTTVTI